MTTTQTPDTVDNRCRFCEQPVRWSTSYDEPHWVHVNLADIRCRFCEQPVRWSTSYDEPHWVHVNLADIVTCPQYSGR